MARQTDPLSHWLDCKEFRSETWSDELRPSPDTLLEQVARYEKMAAARGLFLDFTKVSLHHLPRGLKLRPSTLALAQSVCIGVPEVTGAGAADFQDALLFSIGRTADPSSIPFWQQLLDLGSVKERYSRRRRQLATAALAFLHLSTRSKEALNCLRAACGHSNAQVREWAAEYLARVYFEAKKPLPPDVVNILKRIALTDPKFEPRYVSRNMLHRGREVVPLDIPDGAFRFSLRSRCPAFSCIIEVESRDSLDQLSYLILEALGWDTDHLYDFFVNGKYRDERFESWVDLDFRSDDLSKYPLAAVGKVGQIGFRKGDKLAYLYDFGDMNLFKLTVNRLIDTGGKTRVLSVTGEPPQQYPDMGSW